MHTSDVRPRSGQHQPRDALSYQHHGRSETARSLRRGYEHGSSCAQALSRALRSTWVFEPSCANERRGKAFKACVDHVLVRSLTRWLRQQQQHPRTTPSLRILMSLSAPTWLERSASLRAQATSCQTTETSALSSETAVSIHRGTQSRTLASERSSDPRCSPPLLPQLGSWA